MASISKDNRKEILDTIEEIKLLDTEQPNPSSERIDSLDTVEILELIHEADKTVLPAVEKAIQQIGETADAVVRSIKNGGRLIYVGAGTSGRLGVLDAAECPPTFGVPPEWVVGIIAGGDIALKVAQEGAEDDRPQARADFKTLGVNENDSVLGLSARGKTPYVREFLIAAKENGAWTGLLCCNPIEKSNELDTLIQLNIGPEIITGSTRMKAGLATKMALTMITTTAMIKLGRVQGNKMVDLQPNSTKLKARMVKMLMEHLEIDFDSALDRLENSGGDLRKALKS